jgi:hypothetical protein
MSRDMVPYGTRGSVSALATGARAIAPPITAAATELLLRQDAARLLPLIHRQCLGITGIGPSNSELSETKPSGAQEKTSIFASYRESIIGNPLVAGLLTLLLSAL